RDNGSCRNTKSGLCKPPICIPTKRLDNVNGPTEDEIYAAIAVLANTERYSVKDNELDDWIA
ncbi:hypothetical protein D2F02_06840, partial [Mycobacteroides abscessus]